MDPLIRLFARMLQPLGQRVMNMVALGTVNSSNDDPASPQQLNVTLLKDEVRDKAEHPVNYGFAHNPPAGSKVYAIFPGGNRDFPIVLIAAAEERSKELDVGEVQLYSIFGQKIYLRKDGSIEMESAKDIIMKADGGTIRLQGKHIENVASEDFKWDVNGMGQKYIATGGYKIHNYTGGVPTPVNSAPVPPEFEPSGVA